MRRLLHLLIMSGIISGMLLFGATSAFAIEVPGVPAVGGDTSHEGGGGSGLLGGEDNGLVEEIFCLVEELLGGGNGDGNGNGGTLGLGGDCDDEHDDVPVDGADPATVAPVGHVGPGDLGGGVDQVGHVPSGGVATGGGTTPVGATALIGTLLAMAAVGAGVARALARS